MLLTIEQVAHACPGARPARLAAYLPYLNAAAAEAEITTPLRAAMWLAQLGHESCDFAFLTEIWGNTPAQLGYEGRDDLGNFIPGDGYRYRGRGALQLTGRANYHACGDALHLPLEEQPDLAAQPAAAFRVAGWFWRTKTDGGYRNHVLQPQLRGKHINDYADAGDVENATHVINGGLNGLMDRHLRFDRACEALGALSLYV